MQINAIAPLPRPGEAGYEALMQRLRALLAQINAVQTLVCEDEEGDGEEQPAPDLRQVRRGLDRLEEMAGELLYQLEAAGDELPLAAVPGVSLSETLAQLVEAKAEELGLSLSSRVVSSGRGHQAADYPSRLLYRIVQEALAHVPAHEGARRLRFSLEYRHGEVCMNLEDDGVPAGEDLSFVEQRGNAAAVPPFLADTAAESNEDLSTQVMRRLRAMVERLGGALEISASVEQGVQLQARVPLHHHELTERPGAAEASKTLPSDTSTKINILIVDSQAVSRAGLRRLLESYADFAVIGEAGDSVQAVSETAELLPQIVLIDAQLLEDQSLEAVRQIRQLNGEVHVLLLAGQENEALLYGALRAGANGYITKESAPDELAQFVRAAARGEVLVQPQLAARLLTRFGAQERDGRTGTPQESLTAREQEVLQLLARGLRNKEIAARLVVSERTVNFHLANIYAKLRVSGRTEALSKALEQGLLKV